MTGVTADLPNKWSGSSDRLSEDSSGHNSDTPLSLAAGCGAPSAGIDDEMSFWLWSESFLNLIPPGLAPEIQIWHVVEKKNQGQSNQLSVREEEGRGRGTEGYLRIWVSRGLPFIFCFLFSFVNWLPRMCCSVSLTLAEHLWSSQQAAHDMLTTECLSWQKQFHITLFTSVRDGFHFLNAQQMENLLGMK